MKRTVLAALATMAVPGMLAAQTKNPDKFPAKPTTAAITPQDLMSRVYTFADDSMMGRQAGTVYHDKGVEYIAAELRRLGLRPAGENGTYFQAIPLVLRTVSPASRIVVEGRAYGAGQDFIGRDPRDFGREARPLNNTVAVYGGMFPDTANMISPRDAAGKVVIFTVPRGWQANRGGLIQRYIAATAVVVATLDSMPADQKQQLSQPTAPFLNVPAEPTIPTFFYSTRAMAEAMLGTSLASAQVGAPGKTATGGLDWATTQAPGSRNVVAVLPGADAGLRGQYVAIGSHSDHEGVAQQPIDHDSLYAFYHVVRPQGADDDDKEPKPEDLPKITALYDSLSKVHTVRKDSIFNGADDDASGSMGMLEVAEAFATMRDKPKRSILFVWHVAEEAGLFGSEYFTDHPTVPRDSIVAQINIDMIGRGTAKDVSGGGPGYLQLIGSRRLSTELGDIVEAEGKRSPVPFRFDYQFDANGHPSQFYCRSDHYNYARYGIPVVFMSTGGHPEYHQVTDEPQYLDYDQLARVSNLVLNVAKNVANLNHRLVVDKPKPDPRGQCIQ